MVDGTTQNSLANVWQIMTSFYSDMQPAPRWWTPHMKGLWMLVVSLGGVNFGFWSHLGCSGQNAIIFSREGLV